MEERLWIFKHGVVLDVYHACSDYTPSNDDGDKVESSIAQPVFLDARITTLVTCWRERKSRGYHQKKLYAGTYALNVTTAIRRLARAAGSFIKSVKSGQTRIDSSSVQ